MTRIINPFEGLEIITSDLIRNDDRGSAWHIDTNSKQDRITLFKRNIGSLTGGHYHLPGHPTRDPEESLLIDGTVTIFSKHMISEEEYSNTFLGPVMFRYHTNVYHAMRAESDILFSDLHDDFKGRDYNVVVKELHHKL